MANAEDRFSGREVFFCILFCLILVAGAFGWGYIYRDRQKDDTREITFKNSEKIREILGREAALKTIPQKAESRRQKTEGKK